MNEILLGLFGGAGATLIWEVALKPRRESRSVAEVLAAEVSINIQMLGAAQVRASAKGVPPDFDLSTMVFDAVAAQVGLLPPKVVNETIVLYRFFKQLNGFPPVYVRYLDEHREAKCSDSPYAAEIERELTSVIDVFNSSVVRAIEGANKTQPMLLKCAFPWWSVRKYLRSPSRHADLEEIAQDLAAGKAEREHLASKLRGD